MPTYQIDTEKQTLAPEGGHNYAWTNVYLVDCASDEDARDCMFTIASIEIEALPEDTNIRFGCWRPGIGGPVPDTVEFIAVSGLLPSEPGIFLPLANTARIIGRSGGSLVWFKRWRGPLRMSDVSGGMLTSDYQAILGGMVADLMANVPILTRSGRAITTVVVDDRVSLWQVRDGTTRDIRSVLAG